jgi:hypothetical protein
MISTSKQILGGEIHRGVNKDVDKGVNKNAKSLSFSIFYLIA